MNDFAYGFSRELGVIEYQEALDRTKEALEEEGFGVLTSIDIQKALKNKLDVDFKPYTILDACNPSFAHKALQEEEQIGLLLPCNDAVQQQEAAMSSFPSPTPRHCLDWWTIRPWHRWPKR